MVFTTKKKRRTRQDMLDTIKELEKQITVLSIEVEQQNSNRSKLYAKALDNVGRDASPSDLAPDELGCAESVNAIFKSVFGKDIGGSLSTYHMYIALLDSKRFMPVDQPMEGDIVISPTGLGNGKLSNGHVGIVGENDSILSNSSATGTFEFNYTIDSWKARYGGKGGYPVLFYRVI